MVKNYPTNFYLFFSFFSVAIVMTIPISSLYAQGFQSPLSLSITFDQWPEESSWDIRIGDSTIVKYADYHQHGDEFDNVNIKVDDINLVAAKGYYFNFYDAFIDGICCIQGSGSFTLMDANNVVILNGGEFEVKESVIFNIVGDLCENGIKDNGEKAIDCGGECAPCIIGCTDALAHNYDSKAQFSDGLCLTCDDGIQNGDETGIDCGGGICSPCSSVCDTNSYTTSKSITADTSIFVKQSILSAHKVLSNLTVEFRAGEDIILGAGFEIDINTEFEAQIGGCVD